MTKTRVLVVDDSALVRGLLAEIINRSADLQCIGAAGDPLVAREMIRNLAPDVITLDVEMPKMDGLDFLARLMRLRPLPVVMVSTLTERGAEATLRALELGAVDFVAKPKVGVADGLQRRADDIIDKVRIAARASVRRSAHAAPASCAAARRVPARRPGNFHLSGQMKVTKAKALNTSDLACRIRAGTRRAAAHEAGGDRRQQTVVLTMQPSPEVRQHRIVCACRLW